MFISKRLIKASVLLVLGALVASSCALFNDGKSSVEAAIPRGVGEEFTVGVPKVEFPLPVVKNITAQTGSKKYAKSQNPILSILSGIDSIWYMGDDEWTNENGVADADGNGPKDRLNNTKILNPSIWAANMAYVRKVTDNRSEEAALFAYLDDRRTQNNSVIDGLGPLTNWFAKGSGASTALTHTTATFKVNEEITYAEKDKDTFDKTGELSKFVEFLAIMRGPDGTTSPSKYFYSTPRPWRMNDSGEVILLGKEMIGDKEFEKYDSNVNVIPALRYIRETRGIQKDNGYPSGHTNAAYLAAWAIAYSVPQRHAEMLARAAQLGENRIVSGMHSPVDVIGGRIMSTAVAASYIANNNEAAKKSLENVQSYLTKQLPSGVTLADFAQTGESADRYSDDAEIRKLYLERMTYGFPQDKSKAGKEMIVPEGAEVLLETRLPYLSAAQRRVVLYTTGIDSGYPLLDESNGWGRLNLLAAGDGYAKFVKDVYVSMDASKGGFHAKDTWRNDISGNGLLKKAGSGELILSGNNTYEGGSIIEGGRLTAASESAFGKGSVAVMGGSLCVQSKNGVSIAQSLVVKGGVVEVKISSASSKPLTVSDKIIVGEGSLVVDLSGVSASSGSSFEILSASNGLIGKFNAVEYKGLESKKAQIEYTKTGIILRIM